MIRERVLGAAAVLGEFTLDRIAAHCPGSTDDVLAVLQEHAELFRVRRPRHASADAPSVWRVVDGDAVRRLARTAGPAPTADRAEESGPTPDDHLLLAEELLEAVAAGGDQRRRRLAAESARDLVRQAAGEALPLAWWDVPVRAHQLPEARMRILLAEADLLLRDPADFDGTPGVLADLGAACTDLVGLLRARTPGADRLCRRLVPLATAHLHGLSYRDEPGGRVLRKALARIRSPQHYPTGSASDLQAVVAVLDALHSGGHRLTMFVPLGPAEPGGQPGDAERALVSKDVVALVDRAGGLRLESACLLGELLLVSAPSGVMSAMRSTADLYGRHFTGPARTVDVTAVPAPRADRALTLDDPAEPVITP
jgi:hypothetical protein